MFINKCEQLHQISQAVPKEFSWKFIGGAEQSMWFHSLQWIPANIPPMHVIINPTEMKNIFTVHPNITDHRFAVQTRVSLTATSIRA